MKFYNWSDSLNLRSINGKTAFFNAPSSLIYNQYKDEQVISLGKTRIMLCQWKFEDAYINKAFNSDSTHMIWIRDLPFHNWNYQSLKSVVQNGET